MPANSTHRDELEQIASTLQPPLAIELVHEQLSKTIFSRGKTILLAAADEIDRIAANYEDMYWWISKHGLNIDRVPPLAPKVSRFDELALLHARRRSAEPLSGFGIHAHCR